MKHAVLDSSIAHGSCARVCAALPLYLVIYAPRRGILEVWHMRHGSRVGILDVGVDGYALTTTTNRVIISLLKRCSFSCGRVDDYWHPRVRWARPP